MKKLLAIIALSGALFFTAQNTAQAQTEGYELGVRNFYGVSFAMPLGNNRLHASAAVNFNQNFGIDALYNWQIPIIDDNWFLFPGVGVATEFNANGVFAGVAAEFGIEYQFDFPLSLSVDVRPTFYFTDIAPFNPNGAIEARWRF